MIEEIEGECAYNTYEAYLPGWIRYLPNFDAVVHSRAVNMKVPKREGLSLEVLKQQLSFKPIRKHSANPFTRDEIVKSSCKRRRCADEAPLVEEVDVTETPALWPTDDEETADNFAAQKLTTAKRRKIQADNVLEVAALLSFSALSKSSE